MIELELRRALKKLVGTRKWLIQGKPITWNVEQTFFVVYFYVRQNKRKLRLRKKDFKYNKRLKVYWKNITVTFRSKDKKEELKGILGTEDVAVIIDAKHLCVSSRGIKDDASATVTAFYGGIFNTSAKIVELQNYLKL